MNPGRALWILESSGKSDLRPNLTVFNPENPFRKSTKFPASHNSLSLRGYIPKRSTVGRTFLAVRTPSQKKVRILLNVRTEDFKLSFVTYVRRVMSVLRMPYVLVQSLCPYATKRTEMPFTRIERTYLH